MVSDFTRFLIRLKIYRSGRQITQQKMANELGISLRSYQRLEQGVVPLDAVHLEKICEMLKVSYEQLMDPCHKEEEFEKVKFYDSLNELIEAEGLHKELGTFSQTIGDLHKAVFEENLPITELSKHPSFVDSPAHLFYTTPSFSWVNPATVSSYDPSSPSKLSAVNNMDDLEDVIKVWEHCYEHKNAWYTMRADTTHKGQTMIIYNACHFSLYDGLPFVIGQITKVEID